MVRQIRSAVRSGKPDKTFRIFSKRAVPLAGMPSPLALILAMASTGALALLALFCFAARDDRLTTLEQGWQSAERATGLMEDYTARAMEISRQVTERAAGRITSHGIDYFRGENWAELGELAGAAPMIGSIWIYDGQGNLVANSLQPDPPKGNFSDREFYPALKNGARAHIMGLTYGRVNSVWFFSYNLSVRDGGELAGIVQTSMYPDKFGKFFASLGLAPGARFRIYRRDGAVIMRWPAAEAGAGANGNAAPLFREHLPRASEGRFEEIADGVRFLRAFRTLPALDLVVTASIPLDIVLQPYWQRLIRNGALLGLAYAALAGFAAAAYRADRRKKLEAEVREASERELRDSESRYRYLFEANPHPMYVFDPETLRFLEVNDTATARYGYTRDEFLRMTIADIRPPEDVPLLRKAVASAVAHQAIPAEWRHCKKDGTVIDVEITWHGIDFAGREALMVLAHDITARKQAEKALQESEERLALALRAGKFGVYDRDLRTGRTEWNRTLYDLWGVPHGEPITFSTFEAGVHPEDLATVKTAIEGSLDPGGTRHFECEYRIVSRADGAVRWVFSDGDVTFDGETPCRRVGIVQDITGRKRIEESLRQSEERFRGIYDHAGTGIAITSLKGQFQSCNPAYSGMLGYTEEEFHALKFPDIVHPEDLDANLEGGRRVRAQEIPCFEIVTRYVAKGGKTVWVHKRVSLLRDAAGEPTGYIALVTDMTERKQSEAALRESEERFRATFENAAVGIAQVAPDGSWLRVNSRLCQITGYPAEELLTKTFQDITHPDDLEADLAQARRMLTGEIDSYGMEKRYLCKDGSIVWVRLTVGCMRKADRAVDYFIAVIEEISDQKLAEERLRRSEERFRGIYEHAGTGISVTDMEGRVLSCNPAFAAILGYSEAELRQLNFRDLIHPEDCDANMEEIRRLIAEEIPSFEIVNRYIAKGGKPIWVHKHISLLRDAAGRPTNITALVSNMTERKRYEEQIRFLMREVNHRAKNMLALVQAVARQTLAKNPEDFLDRFSERIRALAAAQDLLVKNEWRGVDLDELVQSQLAHFKDLVGTRIALTGPALLISASAAQAIGMALHELATNAGKYGALSSGDGRVDVGWSLNGAGAGGKTFAISWRESGGPPVVAPSKQGFGSTVVCDLAESSLEAKVELNFAPAGLTWRLQCPAAEVVDGAVPAPVAIA
ncbi:MAG: PAS domain S-box protein [Rhodomicrobium sp.]